MIDWEDPEYNFREETNKKAKQLGCEVIETNEHLILVDFDDTAGDTRGWRTREALAKDRLAYLTSEDILTVLGEIRTVSRSGKGTHHYIYVKQKLEIQERLMLQAILGSDLKRETLALIRIKDNQEPVSCFFETQAEAPRVRAWLKIMAEKECE